MEDNKDYTKSDLGYEDNTAGPGKESFKVKKGKENAHGNAPRQDGGNSKSGPEAKPGQWTQEYSEGC